AFRWHLKCAQHFFGVGPDLSTFGKGMANLFVSAAVVGKREFMEVGAINKPGMERTFLLSSTHGSEMPALGAFMAAVDVCETEDVPSYLWSFGDRLKAKLVDLAKAHGLADAFDIEGPGVALNLVTKDANGAPCARLRTLFLQEMLRNGVMMPCISVSQAHGDTELDITLSAADKAFAVYAQGLEQGTEALLEGAAVKPVFRAVN
ncbi:MAG: aminotransferase class III-fold pyridoxal phosphate-dependent enzyme, partial [Sulfitobacter sp.]